MQLESRRTQLDRTVSARSRQSKQAAEEANTPRALQKAQLRLQSRQQITPLPMAVPPCSTASSSAESTDCWSNVYKRFAMRVGGVLLNGMEVCERHKLEFLEVLETVCSFAAKAYVSTLGMSDV